MKRLMYSVFPSAEKTISVEHDAIYGGAHKYHAQLSTGFSDGQARYTEEVVEIQFVQKDDNGLITAGLQSKQLAYILLDRAIKLNARFPSPQNEKQIDGLNLFLEGCRERIEDRMERGVMGKLKK